MAILPNLIIQKIATSAVVAGLPPLISAAAPNLDTQVTKEKGGRTWRYDTLDSGSGGLFEAPGRLVELLTRATKAVANKGLAGEKEVRVDERGFTLRRVYFSGAGTTRLQGVIRDPYGALTVVTSEAVTLAPLPSGGHRNFQAPLANGNVLPETVVLTLSSGEILNDLAGDGLLRLDDTHAVSGYINYATGVIRLLFNAGVATGVTVAADYQYGSGNVDYEFLDTDDVALIDPLTFTWSPPPTGGTELLVPPGWQVRFTSTGNLAGVGSIGILCSEGQPGQQLPGFGITG